MERTNEVIRDARIGEAEAKMATQVCKISRTLYLLPSYEIRLMIPTPFLIFIFNLKIPTFYYLLRAISLLIKKSLHSTLTLN